MNYAIILAAGSGQRFDKKVSKSIFLINNKPLFSYCLNTVLENKNIYKTLLVINKQDESFINDYLKDNQINTNVLICYGSNNSRTSSLIKAIDFLNQNFSLNENDIIITLDGDRPLVNQELINKSIENSSKFLATNTIKPIYDSIIDLSNDKYLNRDNIFIVQTPQSFQYKIWLNKKSINQNTDLFSSIDFNLNKNNYIVGNDLNLKITTKDDLNIIKKILSNRKN